MSKLEELIKEFCPNGVEYKKLNEVCTFNRGTSITSKDANEGNIPVISGGQKPAFYHNVSNRPANTITVAGSGAYAGYVAIWDKPIFCADSFSIDIINEEQLNKRYLYHYLLSKQSEIFAKKQGAGIPHVHGKDIASLKIPLPALPVQREIVRVLDGFTLYSAELTAELTARRKQYEFYRDKLLTFDEIYDTKYLPLNDVIYSLNTGLNPRQFFTLNTEDAKNYYVTIREIHNNKIIFNEKTDKINDNALRLCNNRSHLEVGDVLFSGTGTIGETALVEDEPYNWNIKEGVYAIKPKKNIILSKFLMYVFGATSIRMAYMKKAEGGTVKSVSMGEMRKLLIPVPPIEVQERIVKVLNNFDAICSDLGIGLPAEIEKRQKQYEYYRDKLLNFKDIEEDGEKETKAKGTGKN